MLHLPSIHCDRYHKILPKGLKILQENIKIQLGTCFLNPFERRVSKRPRLSALVAEYAVVCSLAAAVETE